VHFPQLSSVGERPIATESSETGGLGADSCWERGRVSQVWQNYFSFGKVKYSAGIMHLCIDCKASGYLHKAQNFDGNTLHAKHTLVRSLGWNLGSLRVHLLVIHILVSQCTNFLFTYCSQKSITASKLCCQDCQTCTKSKSSWSTRCGISCRDIPHPLGG